MHADFPNDGLFPRRGKAINYTLNGKKGIKRGNLGEAAKISVNGLEADMHTLIHANDVIVVEESTAGDAAVLKIADLPEFKSMIAVKVNGSRILLPRIVLVNGEEKTEYYEVCDGDDIVMSDHYTVAQVKRFMDVTLEDGVQILVNNETASDDTPVYENFDIKWAMKAADTEDVTGAYKSSFDELPEDDGSYKGSKQSEETSAGDNNIPVKKASGGRSINVSVNGEGIRLSGKNEYVFVDVFDYIDFDLQNVGGKRLITDLNGHKAEYMEPIYEGAEIVIRWEN